jgi:molybdopterin molybdotransferase
VGNKLTDLLTVREAQERILAAISPRAPVNVPLLSANHQVLAQDIHAVQDLPPFANSGMDGFAIRSQDLLSATKSSPVTLEINQDIPAGQPSPSPIHQNQAARIMTGAPLPPGADAVVPIEDTNLSSQINSPVLPDQAQFFTPAYPGQYVRPQGQDIQKGQVVITSGRELLPQDLGLLASLGYAQIPVIPRPRIALFSSGDELIPPGLPLTPGKIYDANQFFLSALLADAGAECLQLGTVRDDPEQVQKVFDQAIAFAPDLILSSAGVSVGAFDYIRQIIEKRGSLNFWRVNMRPGKPLAFGQIQDIPFVGLPGNPVSAFVGSMVFIVPMIRKLRGLPPFERKIIRVHLAEAIESDGRESYLRAVVRNEGGNWVASLSGHQGSGNLFALVQANALLIVPSGVKSLPANTEVDAWQIGVVDV